MLEVTVADISVESKVAIKFCSIDILPHGMYFLLHNADIFIVFHMIIMIMKVNNAQTCSNNV